MHEITIEHVLKFDVVDMEHYDLRSGGAVIVRCFDDRFDRSGKSLFEAFYKMRGWDYKDLLTKPGGVRVLASSDSKDVAARQGLLEDIETAIKLHKANVVVLSNHVDCGGYGYSQAFTGVEAEWKRLSLDLAAAEDFLRGELPSGVAIECWIAAYDGMYRVYRAA